MFAQNAIKIYLKIMNFLNVQFVDNKTGLFSQLNKKMIVMTMIMMIIMIIHDIIQINH